MTEETKKIISEAKNICLIPSEHEPESLSAALALFYTLRELGKNVNLLIDNPPENLNFLMPSVDFMTSPKNFVISIPRSVAGISQIYYEKTDDSLNIHLATDRGSIKKEDISFYFKEAKPDLVITCKIPDFKKHLDSNLDSFGYLLGSPILNIDNNPENTRFGQENMVEEKSLAQILLDLLAFIGENPINKDAATCLLASLMIYYDSFKSEKTTPAVFKMSADLMEKGADYQKVVSNLSKEDKQILKTDNVVLA